MAIARTNGIKGIVFSLPPSVNSCWRTHRGRVILSSGYRKWRADNLHCNQYGDEVTEAAWPCSVVITIFRGSDWRACDIDNRIKPILDQLKTCGYLKDDNSKWVHSVSISLWPIRTTDMESYVTIDLVRSEME